MVLPPAFESIALLLGARYRMGPFAKKVSKNVVLGSTNFPLELPPGGSGGVDFKSGGTIHCSSRYGLRRRGDVSMINISIRCLRCLHIKKAWMIDLQL